MIMYSRLRHRIILRSPTKCFRGISSVLQNCFATAWSNIEPKKKSHGKEGSKYNTNYIGA